MTPRFLLDANICIYALRGTPIEVRRRLAACRPGEAVTSAIVFAELLAGGDIHRPNVEALIDQVPALPFDALAARRFLPAPRRRGSFDRLIAAHALSLGLTLVTNNERDFADIPGLLVENWTLP